MGSKPTILPPEGADMYDSNSYDQYSSRVLDSVRNKIMFFFTYQQFSNAMVEFQSLLAQKLNKLDITKLKFHSKNQILLSYFNFLDSDLNSEKLFSTAMAVYHRISSVYGNIQPYPKKELSKINFPLIAKYLAYNYDSEDEATLISEKIIKRTNFLSEEFPYKLSQMIHVIRENSAYVYGYDKDFTINFYIEHYTSTKNTYIDYIIYIMFIIEIVLPCLRENGLKLSEKINIIMNFNENEPNTELISFIMTYMSNFYPLTINKMHIVNYDIQSLRANVTFINELEKIDYFRVIFFHNNKNYSTVLSKLIEPAMLSKNLGGNAVVKPFCFGEQSNFAEDFSNYLISNILCLELNENLFAKDSTKAPANENLNTKEETNIQIEN